MLSREAMALHRLQIWRMLRGFDIGIGAAEGSFRGRLCGGVSNLCLFKGITWLSKMK